MIGMIALAGIVTRSSIIIVDFVHLSLARGLSLKEAIIQSCVVRLRPILLTASVAMLSALPIATDPIFSGLAWALIFGLLASTAFTLLVIPVVYYLLYFNKPGHGMPQDAEIPRTSRGIENRVTLRFGHLTGSHWAASPSTCLPLSICCKARS